MGEGGGGGGVGSHKRRREGGCEEGRRTSCLHTCAICVQWTYLTGPEGFASSAAELQYKRDTSKICFNLKCTQFSSP